MLKKIWKYISGKSNFIPSQEQIMLTLAGGLALYHLGFVILYICFKMDVLITVNIFSVFLYTGCTIAIRRKIKLLHIIRICYAEVGMQVLIAGALLGYQCGFQFYLVAISCHAFYTGYIYRNDEKINAMHYVLIEAAIFAILRIWTINIPPMYAFHNSHVENILYAVNYFTAIFVIVMFMSTMLTQIIHLEGELLQKNEYLEILSRTDALTGLVNRRSIEENYHYVMTHSRTYAIILADIDDFKKINDTYGHNTGDLVLQQAAEIFKKAVREDDMVCRWGGEEILVFLPLCKKEGAKLTANRILERIRKETVHSAKEKAVIHFSMTFGVADSNEGKELHEVIQTADGRLYEGKAKGKNCIICGETP